MHGNGKVIKCYIFEIKIAVLIYIYFGVKFNTLPTKYVEICNNIGNGY